MENVAHLGVRNVTAGSGSIDRVDIVPSDGK